MKRLALALLALLAGCLPNLNTLQPPRFTFMPEGSGLLRLDPPGVGEAQAVFRFNLNVQNPNAFGLHLAGLDGQFFLNGRRVAESSFAGEVNLPAGVSSPLALEVRAPLSEGLPLLADLALLLAGRPTEYRVEARPILAFGGLEQPLPSFTIVAGRLEQPLALLAPSLTLDAEASGLREASLSRAVYEVVLRASNPGPLGFVLEASSLELSVAGQRLASLGGVRAELPAFSESRIAVPFELSPAALGVLAGGVIEGVRGDSPISVEGALRLELPGITRLVLEPGVLVNGVLD